MTLSESSVLRKIAMFTQNRVEKEKERMPMRVLMDKLSDAYQPQPVRPLFDGVGPHIIAEIKHASPSAGVINAEADPVQVAGDYLKNGARMISVLTEPEFFYGHQKYLQNIRRQFPDTRLLMKDFILDEYQLVQGRLHGADAILLIAALLGDKRMKRLFVFARTLGLTPLIEVHDAQELQRALELEPELVGVNNRDLNTLEVSLDVSRQLANLAPSQTVMISESGIRTGEDLRRLARLGYRGFLVGTALMRTGTPGLALSRLLKEAE